MYEGSIIRAIRLTNMCEKYSLIIVVLFHFILGVKCRRLDELLQQLKSASIALGNTELGTKFDECSNRIRRDIVFAASLYL